MKAHAILAALMFSSSAIAEKDFFDLPATPATTQLQALAEKHKGDLAALDTQRSNAVSKAQQPYLAALAAAENTALAASQLAVAAAVTKERASLNQDSMPAQVPQDLPASLQPARKKYVDTIEQITAQVAARREKIEVEYVRSLNGLETSSNPELSKAIENEKLRVLSQARPPAVVTPAISPPVIAKASPNPSSAHAGFTKPLKDFVESVPFSLEFPHRKFKPDDPAVPADLRVNIGTQQIQIVGTKKGGTNQIDGGTIAHYGKLVLISLPAPQTGSVYTKVAYGDDATRYGISLELADGSLKSSEKFLKKDTKYDWSAKIDGDTLTFQITQGTQQMNVLQAPAADVKAYGFFVTVRYPGNKADYTVTVGPSPLIR